MNKIETFQQFLTTQSTQISVPGFIFNMVLAVFLAVVLGRVYTRYGTSLSNRGMFARNFSLITMTTMLIITIVKSSLALSLGLVGALSIVRFRAAIKEPEELAYLFLAISVGLGLGADQRVITIVAFFIIVGFIVLRVRYPRKEDDHNLYLTITAHRPKKVTLENIVEILKKHCAAVEMKRFDETEDSLEGAFLVAFQDFNQLQRTKAALQERDRSLKISFLDNKGVL